MLAVHAARAGGAERARGRDLEAGLGEHRFDDRRPSGLQRDAHRAQARFRRGGVDGVGLEQFRGVGPQALDGQARALLTHVGQQTGFDEDQLAFLRDERDFRNFTLVELPGRRAGRDFADAVVRNFLLAAWMHALWARLEASSDAEIAGIAGKAVKESRYHVAHAADWVVRLGDGTDESARRMRQAVARLWPYTAELFETDAVDTEAAQAALGPMRVSLQPEWTAIVEPVFAEAGLALPAAVAFRSTGSRGVHSEHMGYVLAEMQTLQRSFPGGQW